MGLKRIGKTGIGKFWIGKDCIGKDMINDLEGLKGKNLYGKKKILDRKNLDWEQRKDCIKKD